MKQIDLHYDWIRGPLKVQNLSDVLIFSAFDLSLTHFKRIKILKPASILIYVTAYLSSGLSLSANYA